MTRVRLSPDVEWLHAEDSTVVLVGDRALLLSEVAGAVVEKLDQSRRPCETSHLADWLSERFGPPPNEPTGAADLIHELVAAGVIATALE